MRLTVLHNPSAGHDQPSSGDLQRLFERAGHDVEWHETKTADLDSVLAHPADAVVVAGGDGTVRKAAMRLVGSSTPIAILPLGTANNIATSLGVSGPVDALIDQLSTARARSVDAGIARGSGDAPFFEGVGFGAFARAALMLKQRSHAEQPGAREDQLARDLAVLQQTVSSYTAQQCHLILDGAVRSGQFLSVEVLNLPRIGPNLLLAPDADPCDGQLEVVLVPDGARDAFLEYLSARLRSYDSRPDFTVLRARHVQVDWSGSEFHVDDDIQRVEGGVRLELWLEGQCTVSGARLNPLGRFLDLTVRQRLDRLSHSTATSSVPSGFLTTQE